MKLIVGVVALTLVLTYVQANILSSTVQPKPGNDIEALCAGEDVNLTKLKHLDQLVELAVGSSCSNEVKQAISELAPLVEKAKYDPCSQAAIDRFRNYYAKHVETSSASGKERARLPKSLKRFVLAFGLQTSSVCKGNLITNLIFLKNAWLLHLDVEDAAQIDRLTEDGSPVAQMLGDLAGAGAVFQPGDLAPFLEPRLAPVQTRASDQLFVQATTGDRIRKLKSICKHRFRPVYEPLMASLVSLANLGFDHESQPLKCDLECPRVNKEMTRWSRIIFMCESIDGIHIVDSPENGDDKLVRILTREEAAAYTAGKNLDEMQNATTEQPLSRKEAKYYKLKESVVLDGKIFDRKDKRLVKAIESFKTGRDGETIIRRRIKSKGLSLIKRELKQGHYRVLLSAAVKSLMGRARRGGRTIGLSEELAKMLDGAIKTPNDQGADDSPQSGLLSLGLLIVLGLY